MKLRPIIKNKRGNLQDILLVAVVMIAFTIVVFFLLHVWNAIKGDLDTSLQAVGNESTFNVTSFYEQTTGGVTTFDTILPFILFGLIISTIISAFFIQSSPVFFFISIIALIIFVIVAVIFGNLYQDITETSELAQTATSFPITTRIMKNFPTLILVAAAIVILVLSMKPRGQAGGYV